TVGPSPSWLTPAMVICIQPCKPTILQKNTLPPRQFLAIFPSWRFRWAARLPENTASGRSSTMNSPANSTSRSSRPSTPLTTPLTPPGSSLPDGPSSHANPTGADLVVWAYGPGHRNTDANPVGD